MNAKQAYLAWLRQTASATYATAVQKVLGKPRSLGGLNRNLISSMYAPATGFGFLSDALAPVTISAPDLSQISVDASNFQAPDTSSLMIDPSTFSSPDLSSLTAPASSSGSSGSGSSGGGFFSSLLNSNTFSSLINAVGNVASTALTVNAQSSLLKYNTARAAQGQWPVQANGAPVPQSQLYPSASPAVSQFESAISTSAPSPYLILGGLAALAAILLMRNRA